MKAIGVIAEFNPFHKGHEYFIREARRASGADWVIVVMSGDFVQRGEPAIWDKRTRAMSALYGGADLVLELPVCFSTGAARDFAHGAVSILNKLGFVSELWFGSETADAALFDLVSGIIVDEPESYRAALKEDLKKGSSFPVARSEAVIRAAGGGGSLRDFLAGPNNILGIEYYAALKRLKSRIAPKTLKRVGGAYSDEDLNEGFSSAAAIRKALDEGRVSEAVNAMPGFVLDAAGEGFRVGNIITADDFSLLLRYKIMSETAESLCAYHDIDLDLARRIKKLENLFAGFTQFASLLKTKDRAYSNISRSLIRILLGIRRGDLKAAQAACPARVLALNRAAAPLFNAIKGASTAKLITKAAEIKGGGYEKDIFASNLYESVKAYKFKTPFEHELQKEVCAAGTQNTTENQQKSPLFI